MKIIKIISTHKRARGRMFGTMYKPPQPIPHGMKRVEAIVQLSKNNTVTRHMDVPADLKI